MKSQAKCLVWVLILSYCFVDCTTAQSVSVPAGFEAPVFFDKNGTRIKTEKGAVYYRIFKFISDPSVVVTEYDPIYRQDRARIFNPDKLEYYYYENHYMSGQLAQKAYTATTPYDDTNRYGLFYNNIGITGEYRTYWENGQIKEAGVFEHGKIFGIQRFFNENGTLAKTVRGQPLSEYSYFLEHFVYGKEAFNYERGLWFEGDNRLRQGGQSSSDTPNNRYESKRSNTHNTNDTNSSDEDEDDDGDNDNR